MKKALRLWKAIAGEASKLSGKSVSVRYVQAEHPREKARRARIVQWWENRIAAEGSQKIC